MRKFTLFPCSRLIALLVLVPMICLSCSSPFGGSPPAHDPLVPGRGTPRHLNIDANGNPSDNNTGRTVLYVEDNPDAAGVAVISDVTGANDRVFITCGDAAISMLFDKNSDFPHNMVMTKGTEKILAWLSPYDTAAQTYTIAFQSSEGADLMTGVVLNKSVFDLTAGQNRQLKIMTIALGLYGSLYATVNSSGQLIGLTPLSLLGFLKSPVKAVCTIIAVAAAVVSVIVVPVVSLINPVAGLALQTLAKASLVLSSVILAAIGVYETAVGSGGSHDPGVSLGDEPPVIQVTHVVPKQNPRLVGHNEEFHIGLGEDIVFKFYVPGLTFGSNFKDNSIFTLVYVDEPQHASPGHIGAPNYPAFTDPPAKLEACEEHSFNLRFKRSMLRGSYGDGKINFAVYIDNWKTHDWTVNGDDAGFMVRLPGENTPVLHKNVMFLFKFCVVPNCPDIPDS